MPALERTLGRGLLDNYFQDNDDNNVNIQELHISNNDDQNDLRAETRTPGLSRKSNSTLSLVNDIDMEVDTGKCHLTLKPFVTSYLTLKLPTIVVRKNFQERVRELEEMLQEQKR